MKPSECRAVVTGAASGLGRHFAGRLAEAGASVLAVDIDAAGLRSLRKETDELEGTLDVEMLDVTSEESVVSVFAGTPEILNGCPNCLINSAGILRDGLLLNSKDQRKLPTTMWQKVLDVNLTGSFLTIRELTALRHLQGVGKEEDLGDAVVINLSSVARSGNPGQANYSASKAGLDAATRAWALELAPQGVRVVGIAPGVVKTPFLEGISEEALAALRSDIPLGRLGAPEHIWQAVRFAIECDFFTGRVLEVDGGSSMG